MPCFSRQELRALLSVGIIVGTIGAWPAGPALAGDDGQASIWSGLSGLVGLTGKDPDPRIDYRERARLVLPPTMDLPPPQPPVAKRTAGWPVDAEIVKARRAAEKKLEEWRSQSNTAALRAGHPLSPDKLRTDIYSPNAATASNGSECGVRLDQRHCNSSPFHNIFQSLGLAKPDEVVAGQEPDRDWLTDPPKGYRLPTATTIATPDNSKKPPDPHDSKALLYQQPDN